MKKLLLVLLLITTLRSYSLTTISSPITSNTTWTAAGSPYIVTTNSGVFPGVTLTIGPGVTVEFNDGLVFTIKGTLIAHGALGDSITFTSSSATPTNTIWGGIAIQNDQGGTIDFNYCKGFYANYFIKVLGSSSNLVAKIKNSRFDSNNEAIYHYYPSAHHVTIDSSLFENNKFCSIYSNYLTISHCVFLNNEKCIYGDSGPAAYITDSKFIGTTYYVFSVLTGTITRCMISNNGTGVKLISNTILTYDSIVNNSVGIENISTSYIPIGNVAYNYICNNYTNVLIDFSANTDFSYNCWCSVDSANIRATIWDAYDNLTLGVVNFMPFDTICSRNLLVQQYSNPTTITFSPNPATTNVTISISSFTANKQFIITDVLGREIERATITNNQSTINVAQWNNGVYFYQLIDDKETKAGKFVVSK